MAGGAKKGGCSEERRQNSREYGTLLLDCGSAYGRERKARTAVKGDAVRRSHDIFELFTGKQRRLTSAGPTRVDNGRARLRGKASATDGRPPTGRRDGLALAVLSHSSFVVVV